MQIQSEYPDVKLTLIDTSVDYTKSATTRRRSSTLFEGASLSPS